MGHEKKRLAVLTDCLPSEDSTAGSVLRNILLRLPEDWEVKMFVIRNPYLPLERVGFIPNVQITMFAEPQSDWKGVLLPPIKWLGEKIARKEAETIAHDIRLNLQGFSPDYFFVMPQTHLVAQVASDLNLVLQNCIRIVMMTDHHSWWSRTHGLSKTEGNRFAQTWQALFDTAETRVLPSERARRLFNGEFGRTMVLYPTFEGKKERASHRETEGGIIRVAFAGEDYAKREIEVFLEGLAAAEGRILGKAVEFHYFGKTTISQKIFDFVNRGRISRGKLIETLSEFDFAFLPYPKAPDMSIISETSFPSKLASYVAAGLPVIYFGPVERSAAWDYISETGIGGLAEEFLGGDQLFLSKNWNSALSQSYEHFFSNSAFQRSVNEMFGLTGAFLSKMESTKDLIKNPKRHVSRNRFGTWSYPTDSELLDFDKVNRFSPSRALRFLASPVWIISRGLGLIRKHGSGYAFGVAKNMIRGIGKLVSKRGNT